MTIGPAVPKCGEGRDVDPSCVDPTDGSALIEAMVGIGLIALLASATFTAHRSATAALDRAEERTAAIRLAERGLERPRPDAPVGTTDTDTEDGLAISAAESPLGPGPCETTEVGRGPRRVAVVEGDQRVGSTAAVLIGRPSSDHGAEDGPAALRVHLPARAWSAVPHVELRGPYGVAPGVEGTTDCWQFDDLVVGDHSLVVRVGSTSLIDRTHVLLEDRPVRTFIGPGSVDVVVEAVEPAMVSAVADADGARPPDAVHPGALAWLVEGDDARVVTALGTERPVHPGRLAIVVTACANPDALASRLVVDVEPPGATVAVPLAIVDVDGIVGRGDAILELVRREGCADGTGVRPSLRWNGGLTEGMRIALPAGVWEGRLLTSTGSRLTAAVSIVASATPVRLTLP